MPQIPSIAVGQFAPRTPRAGQEQVKSAHEPTGDFSLSLTRMACQCLPQRKKKRLVNGGQLGYVSGIVGMPWMLSWPVPASRFSRQHPALWTRRYNAEPRHKAGAALLTGPVATNKHKHAGRRRDRGSLPREAQRRREQVGRQYSTL
jgi:hypothetical protein